MLLGLLADNMSCCIFLGLVGKLGRAGKLLAAEGIGERRKKAMGMRREPRDWIEWWESSVGKREMELWWRGRM